MGAVQEAAVLTRAMLTELGLESWLKTSGGKGLHVVVPLAPRLDYDAVKGFSKAVVQHLAKTIPQRFVAKSGGGEPGRQDLRRLPAQRARRDHGGRVLGALAARPRRLDAGVVGAADVAEERRAVDDRDGARIPVVPEGRPVGRLPLGAPGPGPQSLGAAVKIGGRAREGAPQRGPGGRGGGCGGAPLPGVGTGP